MAIPASAPLTAKDTPTHQKQSAIQIKSKGSISKNEKVFPKKKTKESSKALERPSSQNSQYH